MLGQNELVSYQFSLFEFEQCARKRSKLAKESRYQISRKYLHEEVNCWLYVPLFCRRLECYLRRKRKFICRYSVLSKRSNKC